MSISDMLTIPIENPVCLSGITFSINLRLTRPNRLIGTTDTVTIHISKNSGICGTIKLKINAY
jgi:hypothetical protein